MEPYLIDVCKGLRGDSCPYALAPPGGADLQARLRDRFRESGWLEFMSRRTGPEPRHHEKPRVAVSGCANGCSRPHVADIGLILSVAPIPVPDECTGCGGCVAACPEGLVRVAETGPEIASECLNCGRCVRACRESGMAGLHSGAAGFRTLTGGRLGRLPRLALELPGLHSPDEALDVLGRVLEAHMARYRPGVRFSLLAFDHEGRVLPPENGCVPPKDAS